MSYSQPRDRLELRLKEIIDNEIGDVTDRRTRFDTLLAAVVDPSVVPPDQRDRAELYLSELAGRAGGGITPSGTVTITSNGTHNVEQYKYADVQVPAGGPDMAQLEIMLSLGSVAGTYTPPAGYVYDQVTIAQDSSVIKPENIKKDVTILGVTGTYDAGGSGTLLTDVRNITIGSGTQTVNLGWQPDMLVFSWVYYAYDSQDPYYDQLYKTLTGSGSVIPGNDTITFTSTGYTALLDGTAWNDNDATPAGEVTVTAIKIS